MGDKSPKNVQKKKKTAEKAAAKPAPKAAAKPAETAPAKKSK
ncbi:MAG: hypothetical protein AB2L14_13945 [Candidatus Xenobiia bacterium LiM19]